MASPPPTQAPKKHRYAAGETQVYYGSPEGQYPVTTQDLDQPIDTVARLAPQHVDSHVDLMTYPPRDLYTPPPEIRLPIGVFQPFDAPTSLLYQSSTLKAVPSSESLLHESKLPLGSSSPRTEASQTARRECRLFKTVSSLGVKDAGDTSTLASNLSTAATGETGKLE
ncbi:hypothetical protein B0H19DRAFT_193032 [Mycena capillaripes]|nr:hypothetical protein B0H19DRAFT_193032 [Mycena capillaripes]